MKGVRGAGEQSGKGSRVSRRGEHGERVRAQPYEHNLDPNSTPS